MTAAPDDRDLWIDERLVVRTSLIEGQGLFASKAVPAATVVIRLGGRVVSSAELDRLIAAADADPAAPYVDALTVAEDAHLVVAAGTRFHFANHSCDPSLWHVGAYAIATRRDLRPGDEATIDYGTNSGADGFMMDCSCQSTQCRDRISSDDWRQSELQQRYRGHWVPALQDRIDALSPPSPAR